MYNNGNFRGGNGRNGNNCGCNCCCTLFGGLADAINNLFSTDPWCNCGGHRGGGCGYNNDWENGEWNTFTGGFVTGVNAANAVRAVNENCGCHWNNGRSGNGYGWEGHCKGGHDRGRGGDNREGRGGDNREGRGGDNREGRGREGHDRGGRAGHHGCGSNANLTAFTACENQCFDAYYARQYALYPYNVTNGCGCGCCCID